MATLYKSSEAGAPAMNPMTGEGVLEAIAWALTRAGWHVAEKPESPNFATVRAGLNDALDSLFGDTTRNMKYLLPDAVALLGAAALPEELADKIENDYGNLTLSEIALAIELLELWPEHWELAPPAGALGTVRLFFRVVPGGDYSNDRMEIRAIPSGFRALMGNPVEKLPEDLRGLVLANWDNNAEWHTGMTVDEIAAVFTALSEKAIHTGIRMKLPAGVRQAIYANLDAASPWHNGLTETELTQALAAGGVDFSARLSLVPTAARQAILANWADSNEWYTGLTNEEMQEILQSPAAADIDPDPILASLPPALTAKIYANVVAGLPWTTDLTNEEIILVVGAAIDDEEEFWQQPRNYATLESFVAEGHEEIHDAVVANGEAGLPWADGVAAAELIWIFGEQVGDETSFLSPLLASLPAATRATIIANLDSNNPWQHGMDAATALSVVAAAGINLTISKTAPLWEVSSVPFFYEKTEWYGEISVTQPVLYAFMVDDKSFTLVIGRTMTAAALAGYSGSLVATIRESILAGQQWHTNLSAQQVRDVWEKDGATNPNYQYPNYLPPGEIRDAIVEEKKRRTVWNNIRKALLAGRAWDYYLYSASDKTYAKSIWGEDAAYYTLANFPEDLNLDFLTYGIGDPDELRLQYLIRSGFNVTEMDLPIPTDRYFVALGMGTTLDPDGGEAYILTPGAGVGGEGGAAPVQRIWTKDIWIDDDHNREPYVTDEVIWNKHDLPRSGNFNWAKPKVKNKPWIIPAHIWSDEDSADEKAMAGILPHIEFTMNFVSPFQVASGVSLAEGRVVFHMGMDTEAHAVSTGAFILRMNDVPLTSSGA